MPQNYRNQTEAGRSQEHSHGGQRSGSRDRYDVGNERRYSPDWDERFYDSSGQEERGAAFAGDRSYAAGGYPEELGYRREPTAERDRGAPRYGNLQDGRDQPRGSYYDRPTAHAGRNLDYGRGDFGASHGRSYETRYDANRYEPGRGEDFERGYGSYYDGQSSSGYFGSGKYHNSPSQSGVAYERDSRRNYAGERNLASDEQSHTQQASHRGRGPKGYERSDERLRELICERLTDDPYIDASEVTVEVNNKVVKLTGTVDERRVKYLIEEVIEQCGGARDIDNQLRVQPSQGSASSCSQTHLQNAPGSYSTSQYGTSSDPTLTGRNTDKSVLPSTKRN